MVGAGLKPFVDLTSGSEVGRGTPIGLDTMKACAEGLARERTGRNSRGQRSRGEELRFLSLPVPDGGAAPADQLAELPGELLDGYHATRPSYIHCCKLHV